MINICHCIYLKVKEHTRWLTIRCTSNNNIPWPTCVRQYYLYSRNQISSMVASIMWRNIYYIQYVYSESFFSLFQVGKVGWQKSCLIDWWEKIPGDIFPPIKGGGGGGLPKKMYFTEAKPDICVVLKVLYQVILQYFNTDLSVSQSLARFSCRLR
jgi:hypothetical protein